jgi:hypothetical protein
LVCGFQLFDKENINLLTTPESYNLGSQKKYKEWILEEDERVIGFKSRKRWTLKEAWHYDF